MGFDVYCLELKHHTSLQDKINDWCSLLFLDEQAILLSEKRPNVEQEKQEINHSEKTKEQVHSITSILEDELIRDIIHGVISELSSYFTNPICRNESADADGQIALIL